MPLYAMPLAYTAFFLAAVFALWLAYAWRGERRRRKTWDALCQCRLCAEWLRHASGTKLFRCPSCGALNEHSPVNDI